MVGYGDHLTLKLADPVQQHVRGSLRTSARSRLAERADHRPGELEGIGPRTSDDGWPTGLEQRIHRRGGLPRPVELLANFGRGDLGRLRICPLRSTSTYRPRCLSRSTSSAKACAWSSSSATSLRGIVANLVALPGALNGTAAVSWPAISFIGCHSSIRPSGARSLSSSGMAANAARLSALPTSSTAIPAIKFARALTYPTSSYPPSSAIPSHSQ